VKIELKGVNSEKYRRYALTVSGASVTFTHDQEKVFEAALPDNASTRGPFTLCASDAIFFDLSIRNIK
jgi:hypothetical protein